MSENRVEKHSDTLLGTHKGKERERRESGVVPGNQDREPFLNRLTGSTSKLLHKTWSSKQPSLAEQALSSLPTSAGKGEPGSVGQSGHQGQVFKEDLIDRSSDESSGSLRTHETFRTPRRYHGLDTQAEFDDFLTNEAAERRRPSHERSTKLATAFQSELSQRKDGGDRLTRVSALEKAAEEGGQSGIINSADGEAVVALLERKGFDDDNNDSVVPSDRPAETQEASKTWNRIPFNNPNAETALNARQRPVPSFGLVPNFGDDQLAADAVNSADMTHENLQPWLNMLDRYHDEVWGDLLPVVQQARTEIRAATQRGSRDQRALQDLPAVQRLRMLLGHIGQTT